MLTPAVEMSKSSLGKTNARLSNQGVGVAEHYCTLLKGVNRLNNDGGVFRVGCRCGEVNAFQLESRPQQL